MREALKKTENVLKKIACFQKPSLKQSKAPNPDSEVQKEPPGKSSPRLKRKSTDANHRDFPKITKRGVTGISPKVSAFETGSIARNHLDKLTEKEGSA